MEQDGNAIHHDFGSLNKTDSCQQEGGVKRGVLIIAAALVALRLGFLAFPDLLPEEAYYWNYAMHLDIGYLDHPPMVAWLIHAGTAMFGGGEFGVRIGALLCSLATGFFVYRLATLLYDSHAGCNAVLLVQVLPFFFFTGFIITPDAPLTACWAGGLYFLAQALLRERAGAWLGFGVCLGLGLLSKYTIALLGPATLLFIALDATSRRWWRHPAPYAAVVLCAAIFSPVIIWNSRHEWASFAFQSVERLAMQWRFSTHELLGAILLLLSPIGVVLVWKALRRPCDSLPSKSRLGLFVRIYTLAPLSVIFLLSLTYESKLNWTGPLWLAVIPAIATGLETLAGERRGWLRRAWHRSIALLSIVYVVLLTHLGFGLPGIGYMGGMTVIPVGWAEMGHALEARLAAVPLPPSGRVLLVGLDRNFIASEAAFYHSRQREAVRVTTGAHLFGSQALMYEFWFPPREQRGATLLLVSFDRDQLDSFIVHGHCAPLGDIEEHWVERNGKRIRRYFTRVAENYRPERAS